MDAIVDEAVELEVSAEAAGTFAGKRATAARPQSPPPPPGAAPAMDLAVDSLKALAKKEVADARIEMSDKKAKMAESLRSRGADYESYQRTTSAFFPWPSKGS